VHEDEDPSRRDSPEARTRELLTGKQYVGHTLESESAGTHFESAIVNDVNSFASEPALIICKEAVMLLRTKRIMLDLGHCQRSGAG
jgi:hypothetical protein